MRFSCNRKIGRKEREVRKEERKKGCIYPTQGTSSSEAVRIEKGLTLDQGIATVVPYPTSRRQ